MGYEMKLKRARNDYIAKCWYHVIVKTNRAYPKNYPDWDKIVEDSVTITINDMEVIKRRRIHIGIEK
jgi:hypothetical protein